MAQSPVLDDATGFWPALLSAALIGGRQATPPPLPVGSPLDTLLTGSPEANKSVQILRRAGAWDWYEQTGRDPGRGDPAPVTSPFDDNRPLCPPPLVRYLREMLAGRFPGMWPECLQMIVDAGLRLPPALLPDMLQRGRRNRTSQPLLRALLGPHGQWLAAQNPGWWYVLPQTEWSTLLTRWHAANAAQRTVIFNVLRRQDPDMARTLLQNTWSSCDDPTRQRLIRLIADGLATADEPILAIALADRKQQVRRKAGELLSGLPTSAYARRFVDYAEELLSWRPAGVAPAALNIRLPGHISAAMQRDGVPVMTGSSQRKQVLRQRQVAFIIAAVPLATWTDRWRQSPANILAAAANSRWPRTLSNAFAAAARRQRNAAWALAIIKHEAFHDRAGSLIGILPPADYEALLLEVAGALPATTKGAPLLTLLRHWPHPLTPKMNKVWRRVIHDYVVYEEPKRPSSTHQLIMRRFPTLTPLAEAGPTADTFTTLAQQKPDKHTLLRSMIATLRFRQRLYDIMAECPFPEES